MTPYLVPWKQGLIEEEEEKVDETGEGDYSYEDVDVEEGGKF
jgi:hypothetical protein